MLLGTSQDSGPQSHMSETFSVLYYSQPFGYRAASASPSRKELGEENPVLLITRDLLSQGLQAS